MSGKAVSGLCNPGTSPRRRIPGPLGTVLITVQSFSRSARHVGPSRQTGPRRNHLCHRNPARNSTLWPRIRSPPIREDETHAGARWTGPARHGTCTGCSRGLPAASDRPGSRMGRDGLGCSRTTGPPTHPSSSRWSPMTAEPIRNHSSSSRGERRKKEKEERVYSSQRKERAGKRAGRIREHHANTPNP
jgi:hypothetical protein